MREGPPPNATRRVLGLVAVASAAYVIIAEIPFWGRASSLAPVLTALAVSVLATAFLTRFWEDTDK